MFEKIRNNKKWKKFQSSGSLLTVMTIIGVAIGLGLGLFLRSVKNNWTPREVIYVKFVGDLFLRTLSALVLPLIVFSLVDAVGSLDLSLSKRIGARAIVFYLGTTGIAAVLGLVLVVAIQPGNRTDFQGNAAGCAPTNSSAVDTILDLVRNIFPNNLVGAAISNTHTKTVENDSIPFDEREIEITLVPGSNLMGLVVFAMVLGATLGSIKDKGKPVLDFCKSFGEATMIITGKVVSFSPVAICSLIAGQLVELEGDILEVFINIGWYFMTVVTGLIIHGIFVLPLLYFLLTRSSPLPFILNMSQALASAFGTASSSATLPLTMHCLEIKNKVDIRVSRFVVPIGATVNMNGTSLYLPVAAVYIAQLCGQTLSIGQLISASLISIATSIGAAGIPQIGMVILITVLSSLGLPPDYVAYIIPIDWLVERFRTVVNVLGDSIGAGIVASMSKADLARIPLDPSISTVSTSSSQEELISGKSIKNDVV